MYKYRSRKLLMNNIEKVNSGDIIGEINLEDDTNTSIDGKWAFSVSNPYHYADGRTEENPKIIFGLTKSLGFVWTEGTLTGWTASAQTPMSVTGGESIIISFDITSETYTNWRLNGIAYPYFSLRKNGNSVYKITLNSEQYPIMKDTWNHYEIEMKVSNRTFNSLVIGFEPSYSSYLYTCRIRNLKLNII